MIDGSLFDFEILLVLVNVFLIVTLPFGDEPGVVGSDGRVMSMSKLPSEATEEGAGGCTSAGAGSVGSYSLMVEARRWKSEGGASEPQCGGSAYRPRSVG